MSPRPLVMTLLALAACAPAPDKAPGLDQETAALVTAITEPAFLTYHPDLDVQIDAMTQHSSGVLYRDTKTGTGDSVQAGVTVVVRYTGWLPDGAVFDSNIDGPAYSFRVGAREVIEGWDNGLLGMRVGGVRQLVLPYQMGYGEIGNGPIPPYATLVFRVELLELKR